MSDWAVMITAIAGLLVAIATLTGVILSIIRVEKVHTLTNRNFTEQKAEITRLTTLLQTQSDEALKKSEDTVAAMAKGKDATNGH